MFSDESSIYGLKYHAKCISSVQASTERHEFLVGTSTLKDDNEIHRIDFDERTNNIICKAIYKHKNEVWHISPCPSNEDILFTVGNNMHDGFCTRLWRTPSNDNDDDENNNNNNNNTEENKQQQQQQQHQSLELIDDIKRDDYVVKVVWHPQMERHRMIIMDEHEIHRWSLVDNTSALKEEAKSNENLNRITAGTWDPHHYETFLTTDTTSINIWDLRTMQITNTIMNAHHDVIRDIDCNPNKPYHVVTGGEDRRIKFWDVRKVDTPLKVLTKHTHWVWNVRHNPFHDQLVLSCGTDSTVNLWSMVSVSSAPLGDLEDPANEKEGDKLVKTYDEHEDSVYAVAWSACDAWIFASLSHGGRVVINHVPPAEKYKILL